MIEDLTQIRNTNEKILKSMTSLSTEVNNELFSCFIKQYSGNMYINFPFMGNKLNFKEIVDYQTISYILEKSCKENQKMINSLLHFNPVNDVQLNTQ